MLTVKLYSNETARLHVTKAGKLVAMPWETSISFSHRGVPQQVVAMPPADSLIKESSTYERFLAILQSA